MEGLQGIIPLMIIIGIIGIMCRVVGAIIRIIRYPGSMRVMTQDQFDRMNSYLLFGKYDKLKSGKIKILENMPAAEAQIYYQFLNDGTSKYMRNKIVKPGLFGDKVIKDEFYLKD